MAQFPSMRWPKLRRVLERDPLNYVVTRQNGSHKTLKSPTCPTLHLAFHDNQTLAGGLVEKILTKDVGLTEEEALALL